MSWEVDGKSAKRMSDIAAALKDSDRLILATDPDREGEAISWHVLEILKKKGALKGKEIERVVFNAITKQSVLDAMKHPRQVDPDLSMPISPAGRSTISSALPCRRCCGANCLARVRPDGSSPWPCASSATGNLRSKPSRRRNTGPSMAASRRRRGDVFSARLNAIDGQETRQARYRERGVGQGHRSRHSRMPGSWSTRSKQAGQAPSLSALSVPQPCSRRPRASSASPPPGPCRLPSACMRASISAAR